MANKRLRAEQTAAQHGQKAVKAGQREKRRENRFCCPLSDFVTIVSELIKSAVYEAF